MLYASLLTVLPLSAAEPVTRIALGSCADQDRPQPIWEAIVAQQPQLFLFLGDNVYADTEDMAVIRTGGEYLTIVTSFYLLFTAMFIYSGVMRGAGDTLIPMFLTLISLWLVRIPAALFLSKESVELFGLTVRGANLGESGIWWSIPAGWGIGLLLSFLYYRTGRWKTKTVLKVKVEPATITR